ncbi:MAG: hypothetical protein DCF15_08200 [Phormidesmis priestleyi]|uniref:Uncharacterized protein n=1 Tax=Phormidesmis priestleyi TaxID=268141 RepID=A0A2W4ZPB5_9CYAN|nr:MAG: hypothetical protein DCF15_08200 [Phormidesmis priestleyi]
MSVVPSQILYLEHGATRLYAEAIQIMAARHLCWARPTLLIQGLPVIQGLPEGSAQDLRQEAIAAAVQNPEDSKLQICDLEGGPDLIWPLDLFQIACDIDFFSLLIRIKMSPEDSSYRDRSSELNAFIHSFWHTDGSGFHASDLPSLDVR